MNPSNRFTQFSKHKDTNRYMGIQTSDRTQNLRAVIKPFLKGSPKTYTSGDHETKVEFQRHQNSSKECSSFRQYTYNSLSPRRPTKEEFEVYESEGETKAWLKKHMNTIGK